jgi:cyclopropane fatty-acyl-phospholipid synthase-like methyltransferase
VAINSHDVVLDAGCGVGGTSLYIAETTGARVEGITLSNVQLEMAKGRAAQSAAAKLLNFSRQDYVCTNFADAMFSKLFGIESICYANEKRDFLNEAYRIIKPGGQLAVVDVFLTKEHLDAEEQHIYTKFIEGWVVPNLTTQTQFSNLLAQTGFENITFRNMQQYIEKSVKRVYRCSFLTWPINLVKSRLGIARENLAALYQKSLYERGIAIYGAFVAEKPK